MANKKKTDLELEYSKGYSDGRKGTLRASRQAAEAQRELVHVHGMYRIAMDQIIKLERALDQDSLRASIEQFEKYAGLPPGSVLTDWSAKPGVIGNDRLFRVLQELRHRRPDKLAGLLRGAADLLEELCPELGPLQDDELARGE